MKEKHCSKCGQPNQNVTKRLIVTIDEDSIVDLCRDHETNQTVLNISYDLMEMDVGVMADCAPGQPAQKVDLKDLLFAYATRHNYLGPGSK